MLTTSANRTILQLNAMQILLIIKLCDPSVQIVLFSRPERNQIVSEQHHVPSVTTNWVVRQSRPTLLRLPIGCCSGVSLVFFTGVCWPTDDNFCYSNQLPNDSIDFPKNGSIRFNQPLYSVFLDWDFIIELSRRRKVFVIKVQHVSD